MNWYEDFEERDDDEAGVYGDLSRSYDDGYDDDDLGEDDG